jgi:Acetoacetate decarboxylase (ADC)
MLKNETVNNLAGERIAAYPPAPWELSGQLWAGLFRLRGGAIPVPVGARPLLGTRWLVLIFVRYLGGTLRYDELALGTPVVYQKRRAIWVDRIWVDSEQSLWGGRRLWGLNKEMARFDWRGDTVRVADTTGNIATLALNREPSRLPEITLRASGLGQIDGQWVAFQGRFRGHLGRAGLRIEEWADRFPYQPPMRPLVSLAVKPFHLRIPAAEPIIASQDAKGACQ